VAIDERHVALPKLYGAPAYSPPIHKVRETPRPFDPDDLPIAAVQTVAERDMASTMPDAFGDGQVLEADRPSLRPRPLSLKAFAGRILGSRGG
jgi:hypothetical protein